MNKTRGLFFTASLVLAITFTISCEDKEDKNKFTDSRDGKTYKKVTIGSQTWMAENLNFAAEGSKCYGEDADVVIGRDEFNFATTKTLSPAEVQANCDKYGRLYNWNTAIKVCPSGWHLPRKDEYEVLDNTVGGGEIAGKKLKSSSGWNDNDGKSGNGTDDFGFSALPGGNGDSDGFFDLVGNFGYWWTASEYENLINGVYGRIMDYGQDYAYWSSSFKPYLHSVRCIQN
jgi:uncharacterized protein (TIGR02145 family)